MSSDKYERLIRAEINFAEGLWTLISCDLPGLLLANADLEAVLDDAPDAIKLLFQLNYGMTVTVHSAEYGAVSHQPKAPAQPRITPPSAFTVMRQAA